MRPPHTLADQQRLLADPRAQNRPDFRNLAVGHPAGQLRDNPSVPIRVQSVPASQRAATQQSTRQLSSFQSERIELEAKGGPNGAGRPAGAGPAGPERVSLAKQPGFQAAGAKTTGPASVPRGSASEGRLSGSGPSGQTAVAGRLAIRPAARGAIIARTVSDVRPIAPTVRARGCPKCRLQALHHVPGPDDLGRLLLPKAAGGT
jgi:hypothetical protein